VSAWDGLRSAAAAAGVAIDEAALERLRAFFALLREAGARQNLTRVASEDEVVEKHALDALLGLTALAHDTGSFVDIGAGNGVPGVPLALARPTWRALLVESERRKAEWLTEACATLELAPRVTVRAERAEKLAREPAHREAYGAAVLRAVGSVPTCLELALPFVRVGGRVVLYRGPSDAAAELEAARAVAPLLGGAAPVDRALALPSGAGRRLLTVEKVAPTDARYPRREGIPAKRPLRP
jgi:16S rRNA (guanine527-N7)-methyltransferase